MGLRIAVISDVVSAGLECVTDVADWSCGKLADLSVGICVDVGAVGRKWCRCFGVNISTVVVVEISAEEIAGTAAEFIVEVFVVGTADVDVDIPCKSFDSFDSALAILIVNSFILDLLCCFSSLILKYVVFVFVIPVVVLMRFVGEALWIFPSCWSAVLIC